MSRTTDESLLKADLLKLALVCLAVFAPPAHAGGPTMTVGVGDDIVKQDTLAASKAKFDLLRLVGIRAVRIPRRIGQPRKNRTPRVARSAAG